MGIDLMVSEERFTGRLKWVSRFKIFRARRRNATGMLFQADIREPGRSISLKWCSVSVDEGGKELCNAASTSKIPRFVALSPGVHRLRFRVIRSARKNFTEFEREFTFEEGDILLVVCDPVQPNVFYRRSPKEDTWCITFLDRE
ncbi:hypothetical protein [Streptomyces sp. NPDC090026]|uniref:hypothetical protein n=1 Tax=Streptomyces sp. NPDC090026 TaxID=3365923 RepID=UPI0037F94ECC